MTLFIRVYRVPVEFHQLHANRVAKGTAKADVPKPEFVADFAVHEKSGTTIPVRGDGAKVHEVH